MPTQGVTPKCGSPSPQLEGSHQSRGVHHPNLRGHTEVCESITPPQRATPKRESASPQLNGPHRSVGVHHPNSRGHTKARNPNSRGHTKACESITPTRGATLKRASPSPQFERPHRSVGVYNANLRAHTGASESERMYCFLLLARVIFLFCCQCVLFFCQLVSGKKLPRCVIFFLLFSRCVIFSFAVTWCAPKTFHMLTAKKKLHNAAKKKNPTHGDS